jgi:hypothetical protein
MDELALINDMRSEEVGEVGVGGAKITNFLAVLNSM